MLAFSKYHGAGNDFILIDGRKIHPNLNQKQIAFMCNRQKGIGADGLMILLDSKEYDFEMKYYNSDGLEGSMCGNGGRCITSFSWDCGIQKENYHFLAIDGEHQAKILKHAATEKIVELEMGDVNEVISKADHFEMNTGSPHYLKFHSEIKELNVFEEGRKIRYSNEYRENGININFIEEQGNQLFVRTYERGVENETLACGTGVTAAAIASAVRQKGQFQHFEIETLGGKLQIDFDMIDASHFRNIRLTGPATFVFEGKVDLT